MANVSVAALLRAPTDVEVREGLERNPGSRRLADRGWEPRWFELRLDVDGEGGEHVHSLVWVEPGRDAREAAEEELEHALEEALRNLRDYEGVDVWPDDVTDRELTVA
ncbi:MAG: hypothetical protein HZB46_18120 [Solirubrobacterales bacterium]|nr:hypothetical protein [Solirubrobacterales bacterium]